MHQTLPLVEEMLLEKRLLLPNKENYKILSSFQLNLLKILLSTFDSDVFEGDVERFNYRAKEKKKKKNGVVTTHLSFPLILFLVTYSAPSILVI